MDPHYFEKPDLHYSEKPDPDPHQSKELADVVAHNGNMKAKYGVVAARKKGRSCQDVKYVFNAHTSKASKRLKVVLLHLWHVNVKTTGGFILISLGDFHTDKIAP